MLWFYEYESIHLKMICLGFFSLFPIPKKEPFWSFSICFVVIWHLNDYISNTFVSNIHHFDYIFLVQVLHLNQSVWSVCKRHLMAKINILFQFWYSWCFDRFTNISSFFGRSVKKLKTKKYANTIKILLIQISKQNVGHDDRRLLREWQRENSNRTLMHIKWILLMF